MRCSEPGNIAPTMASPGGVSATHGSDALMSKKMAPVRRTVRSTSDKASINLSMDERARALDGWSFERLRPIDRLQAVEVERYYMESRSWVTKKSKMEAAFAARWNSRFQVSLPQWDTATAHLAGTGRRDP